MKNWPRLISFSLQTSKRICRPSARKYKWNGPVWPTRSNWFSSRISYMAMARSCSASAERRGVTASSSSILTRRCAGRLSPQPCLSVSWPSMPHRFVLVLIDSACAPSPSLFASSMPAGAIRPKLSASHSTVVVRFIKSTTPRPEENFAVRAVGRT